MDDETKPCLLPQHKERLEMTYGKELDFYRSEIERVNKEDNPDERVLSELGAMRDKAKYNLKEAQSMQVCEIDPTAQEDPGDPEESEPQQ